MDQVLGPFLMTSAFPLLLAVICVVTAGVAFVRQTELGAAAAVAGGGFGALAAASAMKIAMFYTQFSGVANHTPMLEIARVIGLENIAANLLQIVGLLLVAFAMFQRRPSQPGGIAN